MSLITRKGRPSFTKTDDGRLRFTRRYNIRSDELEPATINTLVFLPLGTADDKYTNCVLVDHFVTASPSQGVEHDLVRVFEELSDTPVQLGGVQVSAIGGAFIGTHATTFAYVDGQTKPARSFTYRYIVKGDVAGINAQWLALNVTLAATATLPLRYLVSESAVSKGLEHTIFTRTYYEKPDTYAYPRADSYTFPGKIGFDGRNPKVTQPPQTKQTTKTITESYHIGPVVRDSLGFEVLAWATGSVSYVPTNNNPSGYTGYKAYSFAGCIGSVSCAGSNGFFLGKEVDSMAGTISSNPSTYPTGLTVIGSSPSRWAGQIWKKTNTSVTF